MGEVELTVAAQKGDVNAQIALARFYESANNTFLARRWFTHAGKTGNVEAIRSLGINLLTRDPVQNAAGLEILRDANARGDAEAAHACAMIAAQDQVVSTRRQDALDYVLEAAERGWPLARAELAYLAGAPNGAENDWKALRKAIDPDIWIAAKPGREISAEPRMSVFENCISHDVCDWIVERARPRIARAEVYDPRNGLTRPDEKRTNGSMMFNILESDMILMLVRERIVASAGMPLWSLEPASVLHYTPGQEFKLHFDYMNTEIPSFAHNVAERGQRIATFLIYLNDDYEGGETEFPRAGIRHKGRKGDALLFWNTTQDGKPDPLTLHAGTPTTNGEKWVLSQWLRQRPEKFT